MNDKNYDFRNDTGTWQTGRTQPPKRYGGLIAFLIGLVILLSGISTALSILNFKLYKKLTLPEEQPRVSFFREADPAETEASYDEDLSLQGFGIQGTLIPAVYQRYYNLPNGLYVTSVSAAGQACSQGIVAGDIITEIAGTSITDRSSLEQLLQTFTPGREVTLHLYRNGMVSTLSLVWEN